MNLQPEDQVAIREPSPESKALSGFLSGPTPSAEGHSQPWDEHPGSILLSPAGVLVG
jgi:hypothetical protein